MPVRDAPVAVIFDLDGVLTDTAHAHADAWRTLAERHAFPVTGDTLELLRGRSRADSLKVILGATVVTDSEFEQLLAEKNALYLEAIGQLTPKDLLANAYETVLLAKQLGARVAVGSASKNAPFVLSRLGIASLFDAIVDGNDVAFAKPAPDVFLTAAQRLAVAPQRCAVIEDAAAGIAAAKQAGMIAVGLGEFTDPALCDHHGTDLTDLSLPAIIAALEHR